jgi:ornithine carbamoyltransferase
MVYSKMGSLAMGRLQTGRTSVLYMASNDRYIELQVAEATKAEWESVVKAARTLYSLNMGILSAASTLYALTIPPRSTCTRSTCTTALRVVGLGG